MFFITQDGRKVILRWLPPGELFGFAAVLPTHPPYLVGTEMVEDSATLVWRRRTIRELALEYPKLMDNVTLFAYEHFTWFLAAHLALISSTARERLARVVYSLAQGLGQPVRSGIRLEITNEQLANAANITLFTVSRIMNDWARRRILTKGRGHLIIHDFARIGEDTNSAAQRWNSARVEILTVENRS